MLPFFVQACEFGTLRFFAKSDFQNGRPTEVMQRASLKELSAFVSSCIRFIQPDVCVCDLTSVRFSSASVTSFCWSVLHDPLLRCTCTDFFRFFDLSMLSFDKCGLWEQQGFFKFTKRQECVSDFRTGTLWGRVTRPWGLETCRHDENGASATRCPRHSHRRASVPADTPDGEFDSVATHQGFGCVLPTLDSSELREVPVVWIQRRE